jgi:pimeloyl-ACP methyl ester carboxylesterase
VVRDGIRIGYEMFGNGDPTILLLPAWTIVHSRFWKMQVPYLSRHYRVITYDGPGNGRSDRTTDSTRYAADSYAAYAVEVLDACGVKAAVVVGLSDGAHFGLRLAVLHPDRVLGLVMIGPYLPLGTGSPDWEQAEPELWNPCPDDPRGWEKYNVAYWHHDYRDFVAFFFSECIPEAHSTKAIEDAVGWALEGGPEYLEADVRQPRLGLGAEDDFAVVDCPLLVIHGTDDRIEPHEIGVEAARLGHGILVSMEGAGHMPNVRDPVKVNLLLRDFVERVAS